MAVRDIPKGDAADDRSIFPEYVKQGFVLAALALLQVLGQGVGIGRQSGPVVFLPRV